MARTSDNVTLPTPRPGIGLWIKVARPFTLSATVSPILVGTAAAVYTMSRNAASFHWLVFIATLCSGLFLQIGANFFNEYFDWRYGLDHEGSLGASTVIFRNEMSAGQVLGGGIGSFAIATLFGLVLIALVGPAIIAFGLAGLLIAFFYSAKPIQFSARGLGDVLVYIAMGFLMTWGSYYVQIPHWSWLAFVASIPVGFLVTAILNMNNTRDYQDDLAVNKRTLPVRFGIAFGQRFHATLLYGSYVAVTLAVLFRLLPWPSLLAWATFPQAHLNVQGVLHATERKAYVLGIIGTAQLHLRFGVALALGLLLASIFHIG